MKNRSEMIYYCHSLLTEVGRNAREGSGKFNMAQDTIYRKWVELHEKLMVEVSSEGSNY